MSTQTRAPLQVFRETTCACAICAGFCKNKPCWTTEAEARALIVAGFSDRLMLEWWDEDDGTSLEFLVPAIVGYESKRSPDVPTGRCTFLTADDKCELHALGLKPLEGRVAYHSDEERHTKTTQSHDVRRVILDSWRAAKRGEL
jgi:hypothetical protein